MLLEESADSDGAPYEPSGGQRPCRCSCPGLQKWSPSWVSYETHPSCFHFITISLRAKRSYRSKTSHHSSSLLPPKSLPYQEGPILSVSCDCFSKLIAIILCLVQLVIMCLRRIKMLYAFWLWPFLIIWNLYMGCLTCALIWFDLKRFCAKL